MKKIKNFVRKNIFLLIALLISASLLFFIKENIYRTFVLETFVWLWFFLGRKYKNFVYTSFLFLLVVLPFNISVQIYSNGVDPYVNGIFTNYLVPTVSILDLFVFLFLISSVFEKKISRKDISWELISLLILSIIHFLLKGSIVSVLGISRIFVYLLTFRVALREIKMEEDVKILRILEILVIIQVGIALLQFTKGSSIGLSFLGESVFSSGMKGSNFIDISGNLYIRGYGTFPHPNILAGWLLMVMAILWRYKKDFVFLIICSVGIVLTFSRLAVFLVLIFWVLYIFKHFIKKNKLKIFSFYGLVNERILNLFKGKDGAVIDRVSLFKESLTVLKNNWFIGTGYNCFVKEMGDNMPRTTDGILLNQPVHNIFMLSLCELGIIGTVLLGIGYWKTFFRRKIDIKKIENIFILICLVSIGMIDHYLFSLPQGLFIGMIFLLLMNI